MKRISLVCLSFLGCRSRKAAEATLGGGQGRAQLACTRFSLMHLLPPPPFFVGDETYQDIFRDFSQMASNNPEKLQHFQPPEPQKS